MLKLFHAPMSRSSRFIWLLEELGADYTVEYVTIPRMDGSGQADAKNPHPEGKVPALEHDGMVITESAAIALYLTDLLPAAGIGPVVGDVRRGDYLTWLFYYAGVIEPVLTFSFLGLADNPGLLRTFRGPPEVHKRLLDALANGPYVLGDNFSAVDILVCSIGAWARSALPPGDLMDDYLKRCNERPALQRAQARDAAP
ncbi:MAG: glutathione S-transferase family protein [Gammaproteobacteria bacterium]|nr:glutathione S-transferase family protein [Gammaproteobacteria bacterium]